MISSSLPALSPLRLIVLLGLLLPLAGCDDTICEDSMCGAGVCLNEKCVYPCSTGSDCQLQLNAGKLDAASLWSCKEAKGTISGDKKGSVFMCQKDETQAQTQGGFGTSCFGDATACSEGFTCVGGVEYVDNQGVNDPDAYCTKKDCASDADCPESYACHAFDYSRYDASARKSTLENWKLCVKRNYCKPTPSEQLCYEKGAIMKTDTAGNTYCSMACDPALKGSCPLQSVCKDDGEGKGHCEPGGGTCIGSGSFCSKCSATSQCGSGFGCSRDNIKGAGMCYTGCSCAGETLSDSEFLISNAPSYMKYCVPTADGNKCPMATTSGGEEVRCYLSAGNDKPEQGVCFPQSFEKTSGEWPNCY